MSITPLELLKKLKPTASFPLSRDDVLEFARFTIHSGTDGFADAWAAAIAKPAKKVATKPAASGTANPKPKAPKDPQVELAENRLKEFGASRGLKSAEIAAAFVRYLSQSTARAVPAAKSASSTIGGAIKWASATDADTGVDEVVAKFVDRFRDETDLTYR